MFESLAVEFLGAPELLLLFKFYRYRRLCAGGELGQAVKLLHELFVEGAGGGGWAPPLRFHATLCREMCRLLATAQHFQLQLEQPSWAHDEPVRIFL